MQKILAVFFIVSVFALIPSRAFSQRDLDLRSGTGASEGKNNMQDTIKPQIGLWYLSGYGAFIDSTKLDTLQDYFHIFHPVYKKENVYTASYVGNYGTPALDNNFFNRNYQTHFFFAQSRDAYMLSPSKLKYFNTHTPYTRLDYTQSENKSKNNETRFNVIHSQNVKPWWNFTFRVDLAKSDGQYIAQEEKNNSVSLYSSYTKDFLFVHAGFITNSMNNNENGGLISDSLLMDEKDAEYWNVNLNSTQSHFASSYFFANGEYRFGKFIETEVEGEEKFRPILGAMYDFELNFNRQEFTEEESSNSFFRFNYYPDDYTKDSLRYNRISNLFQLKQYENANKKYSFGKRAFIGVELNRGSMPGEYGPVESNLEYAYPVQLLGTQPTDSMVSRTNIKYSNSFVGGGIFRETGKFWKWNAEGKIYLAGRNAGQTELRGLIYKPMHFWGDSLASISFSGAIENLKPDYFQEEFYSSHYRWSQSLKTEQRLTAGATFKMPARKLEMGAKYAVMNNYVYNDTLGIPTQTGNEILVLSAYLDKDFNYRNLHFRTRILWQKASEERYIHLPEWSAFISAYYQFTISKVLFTQIGSDVRYNTKYYADAYAPSTGLFYLQNEKEYGNYPYIDVYASLRLKRTRVFFKFVNIGTQFLNGEYMTVPHYPMNQQTFRLGVSWAFYD
ncbi:MAG: putative porin [Draconibacterium sp.]